MQVTMEVAMADWRYRVAVNKAEATPPTAIQQLSTIVGELRCGQRPVTTNQLTKPPTNDATPMAAAERREKMESPDLSCFQCREKV